MAERRLDAILQDLGYATEEQLAYALQQQQGLGGRLGSHLIYAGTLTEEQLTHALAVQHGVPPYRAGAQPVAADLAERFGIEALNRHRFLPLGLNAAGGVLSVAVTDPADSVNLTALRRLTGCASLAVHVLPDLTFENLLEQLDANTTRTAGGIALPDLFAEEGAAPAPAGGDDEHSILLVTERAYLRDFLAPLLAREGADLVVAETQDETADALNSGPCDVLVAAEMRDRFAAWRRQGAIPVPRGHVGGLDSIGETLLQNPAPYRAMQAALLAALRMAGGATHFLAPGEELRRDLAGLAAAVGLPRLAADALEAALYCLVPGEDDGGVDWVASARHAASLGLPWDPAAALEGARELQAQRVNLDEFGRGDPETALAAETVAVVWHLHRVVLPGCAGRGDAELAARKAMRSLGGRLARSDVIEALLEVRERGSESPVAADRHEIFVIDAGDGPLAPLAARLDRFGYRVLKTVDPEEARRLGERRPPTASFVSSGHLLDGGLDARTLLGAAAGRLVYGVTASDEPRHLLELFDTGCDDVFCLPRDVDLIGTRLKRDLERSEPRPNEAPGVFGAEFAAFAFTDLLQALEQSLKSVRITLDRTVEEQAVLHLQQGRLVHAVCGDLAGEEAVYRIITWQDEGRFRVEPTDEFPSANVEAPVQSILMEGCRLLDESCV